MMPIITKGDVVQATEDNDIWTGCLLIVDEVYGWGIQAYAIVPGSGTAFIRLRNGKFERVGHAVMVLDGEEA